MVNSTDKYDVIDDDVKKFFNDILTERNIPLPFSFYFIGNNNMKELIKLTKIPDIYAIGLKSDIRVEINLEYYDSFDEDVSKILFDNAIDKIEYDLEKGTFKLSKANFNSNFGFIKKHTYEKVERALEIEKMYETNKKNKED